MDRVQKKELIAEINQAVTSADIVLVSHYKGLTVAQIEALRSKVRAAGAKFKVTKNRITKLALAGTDYEPLADLFKGPTAIAYAANDPVGVSKALVDFAKTNENLVILGGGLGNQALQTKDIQALAELPSLDELRAKIVGMIQTPATRLAVLLQAPGAQVARVINAYATKE